MISEQKRRSGEVAGWSSSNNGLLPGWREGAARCANPGRNDTCLYIAAESMLHGRLGARLRRFRSAARPVRGRQANDL